MNRTAWTRTTPASSFPSDRIKPNATQQPSAGGKKGKGKGTATPPAEPPKSRPVRQLEALIGELKAASKTQPKPDPKGGCFCQARAHGLSPHTALCRTCGLVLCTVNAPQHACPSCGSSLLTETQRTTLITRLEAELADTLAKEERTRLQAAEEARRAVGAFPTLSGAPPAPIPSQPPPQTRTVLSLNPKTKRVTVSAFTKVPVGSTASTPGSSAPSSRPVSPELDPPRVTAPPPTVAFVAGARIDPSRPYADLSGNGAVYIPPPDFGDEGGKREGPKKKQRGKTKAGAGEGTLTASTS